MACSRSCPGQMNSHRYTVSLQMVLKGTLKAERSSELAIVVLGLVSEGHLIGEMSLLDGQRASATIKALENGERWCLERSQFEQFLEEQPSAGVRLLRYISEELALRVRQSNEQLVRAWEGPFGFDADY